MFLAGFLFYIATLLALLLTGNPNLFPKVVMVGSFMVPVTCVAFFYARRHLGYLTVSVIRLQMETFPKENIIDGDR